MKKMDEGKFEIFTTRDDAIDKFLQLQGRCRSEINREYRVEFMCTEKGKILIHVPGRKSGTACSTELRGEIIEQDGKTFVTYYTRFDKADNVFNIIYLAVLMVITIAYLVFNFAIEGSIGIPPVALVVIFALFVYTLFSTFRGKRYAPDDSLILIKELEKRVEAVNLWDK